MKSRVHDCLMSDVNTVVSNIRDKAEMNAQFCIQMGFRSNLTKFSGFGSRDFARIKVSPHWKIWFKGKIFNTLHALVQDRADNITM